MVEAPDSWMCWIFCSWETHKRRDGPWDGFRSDGTIWECFPQQYQRMRILAWRTFRVFILLLYTTRHWWSRKRAREDPG